MGRNVQMNTSRSLPLSTIVKATKLQSGASGKKAVGALVAASWPLPCVALGFLL